MEITNVRVNLPTSENKNWDRKVLAFCSFCFDDSFVIRDVKIIQSDARKIVCMPSKPSQDHCPKCGNKNPCVNRYCGSCGEKLESNRGLIDVNGKYRYHTDVCHPCKSELRKKIDEAILKAYDEAILRSAERFEFSDKAYDQDSNEKT